MTERAGTSTARSPSRAVRLLSAAAAPQKEDSRASAHRPRPLFELQDLGSVYTKSRKRDFVYTLPSCSRAALGAFTEGCSHTTPVWCLASSRRRSHEGASPLKLPIRVGVGGRHPLRGGRSTSPMGIRAPALSHSQTWARKGSMEQSVHRPLIKSGLFSCPSRQFRCR